jgi:pimeloyl-ACP methyl ester carboxylesterase
MLPFYFGPSDSRLFGVYHAPDTAARALGVVLCQPLGHEYIRAHRTFRQLAAQLARAGFPVLRFDYFGCGDSAGVGEEGSVVRWQSDINSAIDELKDTSGVSSVAVIGLRLGASLALMATAGRSDIERIVLWDPVLNGREYLEGIGRLQRRWLKGRPGSRLFAFRPRVTELIGFPMLDAMRREVEGIDLGAVRVTARRLDVVASHAHAEFTGWAERLSADRGAVKCHLVDDGDWDRPDVARHGLTAPAVVQQLSAMLTDRAA